ncbi:MAG: hypothetical protein HC934_01810 [Acaryochloridaceae cyanobacterium SU_2_1]|nr:hypothetical protein [Acaryochloridaceae cyanobacterium SU_2_1]
MGIQHRFLSLKLLLRPRTAAPSPQGPKEGPEKGFALPIALGMGFVMLMLGMTAIMVAQSDRITAWQRKESSVNLALTEGGMARTLAQLTYPNNAVLLNRNYDTINPKTGKTYLGPDGIANNGDEEAAVINEWSSYNPSTQPCYQQKAGALPTLFITAPSVLALMP